MNHRAQTLRIWFWICFRRSIFLSPDLCQLSVEQPLLDNQALVSDDVGKDLEKSFSFYLFSRDFLFLKGIPCGLTKTDHRGSLRLLFHTKKKFREGQ